MISYGSGWVALASSRSSCPHSGRFFLSSRGHASPVDLPVLLDEEVPGPRDFDGGGGGGHGACGAQGGRQHFSEMLILQGSRAPTLVPLRCLQSTSESVSRIDFPLSSWRDISRFRIPPPAIAPIARRARTLA